VILTLISAAIAAGCATPHAIAQMSREVTYGMTDLPPLQAGAVQLEQLWQAHWTIENRSHYVRDVTLGEDRGQAHTGSTAHALPLGAMGS
jgi:predicted transposase YbfD/YdcC